MVPEQRRYMGSQLQSLTLARRFFGSNGSDSEP
jgi:hypothetical protein